MKVLQILVLIFGLAIFTYAQKAILSGTVTDKWGAVIPSANVEAKNLEGKIISARTNDDGQYQLELVEGEYTIKITKLPFDKILVLDYWVTSKMQFDVALQCKNCELIDQDIFKSEPIQKNQNKEAIVSNQTLERPLGKIPKKQNKTKRKNN